MTKDEEKYFKRLLKEIGLYYAWMKDRKRYKGEKPELLFENLVYNGFSCIINCSFIWASSSNPKLWPRICTSNQKPHEILQNDDLLKCVKSRIKDIIEKNNIN